MAETTSTKTKTTTATSGPTRIEPVPGDPRTEPVATAAESHVAGRVGPRTIQEDAQAPYQPTGDGVAEIEPGTVRADTPEGTGPVPAPLSADPVGDHLAAIVAGFPESTGPKPQGPAVAG